MTKNEVFLIQGLFFTEDYALGIGFDPEIGERVIMKPAMFRTMFAGIIKLDEGGNGEGALFDYYGDSILTNIKLTEEKLNFVKKYNNRNDIICYKLKKVAGLWVGFYNGQATGKGAVRCILQATDEKFFLPSGLEEFFK